MMLVTGATGFVGGHLLAALREHGIRWCATSRYRRSGFMALGPLSDSTDWRSALNGVDTVVHLASMNENVMIKGTQDKDSYYSVNVQATSTLAREAVAAGVRKFIFLSTAKVNGEFSSPGKPFTSSDTPTPLTPYARSKYHAEENLRDIARKTGLDLVILRPPLVYGRGSHGSFNSLVQLCRKGWPLPFGAIDNRRTLINVENLCDLIVKISCSPRQKSTVFMASDGLTVSTADLVRLIAKSMDRNIALIAAPSPFLRMVGKALRQEALTNRLFDNLEVSDSEVRLAFEWYPKFAPDVAMRRSV